MQTALKQRLIGAIVLVALAVIFVPFLLPGEGDEATDEVTLEMPEPPRQDIQTPQPVDMSDNHTLRTLDEVRPVAEPETGDEQTPTETVTEAPSETTSEDTVAAAPPPKPADPAPAESKPAPQPEPAKTPEKLEGFAIQVLAVRDQKAAFKVRDELRDKKFTAYVESYDKNGATYYRVRVGPVLTRAEAGTLQTQLAKAGHKDSYIARHP